MRRYSLFGGAFWLLVLATTELQSAISGEMLQQREHVARAVITAVHALISLIPFSVLVGSSKREPWLRAVLTGLATLVAAVLAERASWLTWIVVIQSERFAGASQIPLSVNTGIWLWILYIASAVLAAFLLYAARVQDQERDLLSAQAAAHAAELRSLRYQINPHFLFNALNALAAMIKNGDSAEAEAAVLKMARFYRSALNKEAVSKVTLREELAVQTDYLDLERVRFGDRLQVEIRVDEDLWSALVPSLIIQPLVENAVKHGVARSSAPVTIVVSAHAKDGDLELGVFNTCGNAPDATMGERIGLENVLRRLRTFYGADASLFSGPAPPNGFRVTLILPLEKTL